MNRNSFITRKQIFFRSPILLAGILLVSTGISLVMFYETLLRQHEGYLAKEVVEQLSWIETIAQLSHGDAQETLKYYTEFNKHNPPLGVSGECMLAVHDDNGIQYIYQQNSSVPCTHLSNENDSLGEPMRQALAGNVGTMIGTDYRGHKVLAAFAPVPHFNWGIVVKVDLAEILSPFMHSTAIVVAMVVVLITGGVLVVVFLGRPLIRELEQSRERLSLVIQGTRNGVWDWSNVGNDVLWWSGRTDELLGYDSGELSPSLSVFRSLLHPEDHVWLDAAVEHHLKDRVPFDIECRLKTKKGEYRWYRIRGQALWDGRGSTIRMSGSLEDIHEQKKAEQIRQRSIRRLEAINRLHEMLLMPEPLEQKCKRITDLAVASMNLDFSCVWLVKKGDLCKTGCMYAAKDLGGRSCSHNEQCLHLVSTSGRYSNINGDHRRVPLGCYTLGKIALGEDYRNITNDLSHDATVELPEWADSLGLVAFAGYKIRNANGEPIGVFAGFSKKRLGAEDDAFLLNLAEITSMVILGSEAAETLRQALITADAATRAKSEFLANMSHEIRTPMTAILGFADVLLGNPPPAEAMESAQIIKRNGDHLLKIINDILDLSKIEAGSCKTETVACSPRQILADVSATMKVQLDAKGLSWTTEIHEDVPNCIFTDPLRLRQILVNLVGNAVKFTEIGGVSIVMQMDHGVALESKLRIDVTDTGIGLTEEQIGLIFKPFSQADGSVSRRFGGTGLGLAISQRLAKILGGDISVNSVLGKGSTFSLKVATQSVGSLTRESPAIDVPSNVSSSTPPMKLDGRILLAEDGPDNQRLITHVLRKIGAQVTSAKNGEAAFQLAMESMQVGHPFDAILMDMQMPVMDGYEATRQLRDAGYQGPIVALTAHAMSDDRQKCLDAGCSEYVTKPIDRANLLTVIAKYLHMHVDSQIESPLPNTPTV
jgi:PAS domain S-box-containing protein